MYSEGRRFRNKSELWKRVKEVWDGFTAQEVKRCIENYNERLFEVFQNLGGITKLKKIFLLFWFFCVLFILQHFKTTILDFPRSKKLSRQIYNCMYSCVSVRGKILKPPTTMSQNFCNILYIQRARSHFKGMKI